MAVRAALEQLKPLLEELRSSRSASTAKMTRMILSRYGTRCAPLDDNMLLSYSLDGLRSSKHYMGEL